MKLHTSCVWMYKLKAAVRFSHGCLTFARKAVARWSCRFARLSQVRPYGIRANFIGSRTFRSILVAAVQSMTLQGVRTTNVRVHTHVFGLQMPQDCRAITVLWFCALLHGCHKNATKSTTTNEIRMTDARLHLRQSCKSARPSCDSLSRERKTTVLVS